MAKKKQTSVAWIQMPTDLFGEIEVAEMYDHEGVAGLGAYFFILSELYRRRSHKMTRNSVLRLHMRGFKQPRVQRVLENYGLFNIDENGTVSSVFDYCDIMGRQESDEASDESSDEHQNDSER